MADRIGLFADRNVSLAVCQRVDVQRRVPLFSFELEEIRLSAAFVDEIAGKLEIFRVAGRIGQLAERELDLLVARVAVNFAGLAAEHGCDVIGVAAERVEEFPAAGGAEVGDRRFHQMPGAVEFMAVVNIFPAVFGIDHREVRVEVAVRLLGGDHEIDVAVKFAGQRLIVRIQREHERHSLEDLCEVGVPEDMRPVRHTLFPGEAEHIDPPGFAAFGHRGRYRGCSARFDPVRQRPDRSVSRRRDRSVKTVSWQNLLGLFC